MSTYKSAGVDLDTYGATMQAIKPLLHRTNTKRTISWPDGFAGLFRLNSNISFKSHTYHDPVLVSGTDGVGTKLKLAFATNWHSTVGIDLVAMSVNDIICAGAEPLFFLDYISTSQDNPELISQLVSSISDGCVEAECALIGGETAIMPGFYPPGEYDLAGFCVGAVERNNIITGSNIKIGDTIIGLPSSGLHSNGYSLALKLVSDVAKLTLFDFVPELDKYIVQEFMVPTKIYAKALRAINQKYKAKKVLHGIAHITGGGLIDNIPRILPDGCNALILRGSWKILPVFSWLQSIGKIPESEMYRVFNMGIGMVLIVSKYYAKFIIRCLEQAEIPSCVIGQIVRGERKVIIN